MPAKFDPIKKDLIESYDRSADRRATAPVQEWKQEERTRFLRSLRKAGAETLIDIGSGPCVHTDYFAAEGLDVTSVDISPSNIEICRRKGHPAVQADVLALAGYVWKFDAGFAMNSLLHIPRTELSKALAAVQAILRPGGLFYLGQYGGLNSEGIYEDDPYHPKRFFSRLTDADLISEVTIFFEIIEMKAIAPDDLKEGHFQSCLLQSKIV